MGIVLVYAKISSILVACLICLIWGGTGAGGLRDGGGVNSIKKIENTNPALQPSSPLARGPNNLGLILGQ